MTASSVAERWVEETAGLTGLAVYALERPAAAGDALSAALGREVRVRARGEGCRVEIDFDTPAEAIQLAERILGKGGQGPPLQSPRRAISSVG